MFAWMDDQLNQRRQQGLYRVRRRLQSAQGARIDIQGRSYLNFASNDYLNLAADPRLARAAARAARRFGCGAGASALVAGYLPPHQALERALARWEQTEAAVVFSSGFAANLGTVAALAGPPDAIFSDALNHASLIDGCRLSGARVHVYRHADPNHLHDLLGREGQTARRRVIVTDTVFSMDGDLAPLPDLLDLARRHDALLVVDEAHATGILGDQGRGATELFGLPEEDRLVKVGTLSKALGTQGGFVCGSRGLAAWLVNHARPYIFSTALAPPTAAAARRAVAVVTAESAPRRRLLELATFLRGRLTDLEFRVGGSRCQIVPVLLGRAALATELSAFLKERGLLVPAIRPPSVPDGTARLRICVTAGHGEDDVLRLAEALAESKKLLRVTSVSQPEAQGRDAKT